MVSSDKGFTVLEAMISLAILAGVVVVVLGSVSYNLGILEESASTVTATILAREKVEEATLSGVRKDAGGVFGEPSERFFWSIRTGSTEIEKLKRLEVRVAWEGGRGVELVSYFKE